jgi:hypothetical protein
MATSVRPRGPLPARVYWARRLVVLGVPLLLVVVLARLLGGSSDAQDGQDGTATQAGATVETSTAPTSGPTVDPAATAKDGKKGRKGRKNQETAPPEPVLAEPSGPCAASDITATPALTTVPGGADIEIPIILRTTDSEACTWQASPETLTVTITSGDDFIWSTRECPASIPVQDVVVRSAVDTPVTVVWSARRSDEECSSQTAWAMPGFYHVEAAALGGEGTDVQFQLTGGVPEVVTETADPQSQGGEGRKNGDTTHTPGEDGSGNSEG